jgi:hypothetical protein
MDHSTLLCLARVLHLSSEALAVPQAAAEARPLVSSIGLQRTSLCVVKKKVGPKQEALFIC